MALRHLLRAQITALKPPDDLTPDYSNRQWRSYLILQAQFVDQRAAQAIREELGISESGYFNDQRYALDLLAQRLQEQEVQQTAQTRAAETAPTSEPSPISQPRPAPLLPRAPTTFIGRQKERAQLAELLTRQSVQLVTLFGAGGMGKTRLAIQAAQDYHEATGEPVCFVALETADTGDPLVPIIAQAVQLSFDAQDDPRQQLRNFLRGRSLLLVLDNMEHLLPQAGEFLQDMLTVAPRLRVLVTSRERLNLRSEWVLSLPGLDVPPSEVEQADLLAEYSAVQLFLSVLARGRGQSEVNAVAADEYRAVREICRLVSGMPLALELAASWGALLSCADIAAEIRTGLDFLAGTYQDLPARHQSLRAVFEHSWRLLDPTEQANFRRLAVFRGSFNREAAAEVAGARLPTLHALASKSLLRVTDDKRYVVHPLLRQFAAEQLHAVAGEQSAVQTAHSRYFLGWVAAQTTGFKRNNRQKQTIAAFAANLENIRTAWQTAVLNQSWGLLLDAAEGLSYFYHNSNRFQEGLEVLNATVAALNPAAPTTEARQLHGLVLGLQGRIHHMLGKQAEAQSAFRRSLAALQKQSADDHVALISLFAIVADLPDEELRPRQLYEACLAYYKAAGDEWGTAYSHAKYVNYLRLSGLAADPKYQRRLLQESLQLREHIGDQRGIASALSLLGDLAYERGDYEEARRYATQSLTLYNELGDNFGRALALNHLGQVAGSKGAYLEAKRYYEESLALLRAHGNPREIAVCLDCVGYITYLLNDVATAEAYYQESLELSRDLDDAAGTAWSLHNLGDVARAQQDFATAQELYQQSYTLHIQVDALSWGGAVALDKLGRVRLELGDVDAAEADFQAALYIARHTGRYREMLDALLNLAQVAQRRGDEITAMRLLAVVTHHSATARETYDVAMALIDGQAIADTPDFDRVVGEVLGVARVVVNCQHPL